MRESLARARATILGTGFLRRSLPNLHYGITAGLAIALFPALKVAGLPTKMEWPRFFEQYWIVLGPLSMFLACVLCLLGFSPKEMLHPIWSRYKREKGRILILVPLLVYLYWLRGFVSLIVFGVVGIATFELVDRNRNVPGGLSKSAFSFLFPACYLFLGLIVVFVFNQIVVALEFHRVYDKVLDRIDMLFLLGRTVPEVAHKAVSELPGWVFRLFDVAYIVTLPSVGAGILITGLAYGQRRAYQFVGTVLSAYYLSLLIFALLPSQSPFYSCPTHFSTLPQDLISYGIQKNFLSYLRVLSSQGRIASIQTAYYIAFPCMHIAQPVILLWFVRQWRRLFVILLAYDLFLMVAIVMLEFHYVIDLFGGIAVAFLAILMVDRRNQKPEPAGETLAQLG